MQFLRSISCVFVGVLTACSPQSDIDLDSISIDWKFRRLDTQMYECAQALKQDSTLDTFQAYEQYFAQDRGYYLESLGLPFSEERKADSLLAKSLVSLVLDPNMYQLLDTIQQVFPPQFPFDSMLVPLVKRLSAFYPGDSLEIPTFCTFANGYFAGGDSRSVDQIQVLPHYFGIGLHFFLGKDFPYYPNLVPNYIRRRFDKQYIETLVATSIAEGMVPEVDPRGQPALLHHVVRKGIVQYFINQLLPNTPDSTLLFYTSPQIEWAETYEPALYKEILPQLYSTDFLQYRDFLEEKPFSTQIAQDAPPRIGQFLGWKIVRSYMDKNPQIGLNELAENQDYEAIFKEASFRP